MSTPATSTATRTQIGRRLNAPAMAASTCSSSSPFSRSRRISMSPSSPSMRTKPPRGIQLRLYRVPCHVIEAMRGGKPMPNSSTVIPARLAARKCPSLVHENEHDEDADEGDDGREGLHQDSDSVSRSRTSRSRSMTPSRSGSSSSPHRSTAVRDGGCDGVEPDAAVEEGADRDLVGGVQHDAPVAACLRCAPRDGVGRDSSTRRAAGTRRCPNRPATSARAGEGCRRGYVSAYWIGRRMSGRPSCALYEPSANSTSECTMLCGWITASILEYGNRYNHRASMTSNALLTSVAESTVIFGPMCQVGCASASSGVTDASDAEVASAKRSAAGGEDETPHVVELFPDEALPDRRMLAVDRPKDVRADRRPARRSPR